MGRRGSAGVVRRRELQLVKPRVLSPAREQLVVRAQLDDAALGEHRDARRVPDALFTPTP